MNLIAKTFAGLEEVLAREITELGANNIQIGNRMVTFEGDKEMLYRANFTLRTAVRVLMPIKTFKANDADIVYDVVKKMDWSEWMTPDMSFVVDTVVNSDDFAHSKFVAYRVKDAVADYWREHADGQRPNVSISNPDLRLHMHISEDNCTLCLDSSGESLHRRGYRKETVDAPLNEVLAAGIILMSGWHCDCDFIDPMCGSGTLPIEAALIARNIAPGVFRQEFGFQRWLDYDQDLFDTIYDDDSHEREFNHHIYGYDINRDAVRKSTANVKSAGMSGIVTIQQQDFAKFQKPERKAIVMMNPPYGERITPQQSLLDFYSMIGSTLKNSFKEGEAWVLSYRQECFDAIGLRPSQKIPLYNGALECRLQKYVMFSGKYNDLRERGEHIRNDEDRDRMARVKGLNRKDGSFHKDAGTPEEEEDNSFEARRKRELAEIRGVRGESWIKGKNDKEKVQKGKERGTWNKDKKYPYDKDGKKPFNRKPRFDNNKQQTNNKK